MEIVEENPYGTSQFLNTLDTLALYLMRPFKISLDLLISCIFPTTEEKKSLSILLLWTLLQLPFALVLTAVTLPISVSGFLLWLTFQHRRQPFRVSVNKALEKPLPRDICPRQYGFMTANLCLLPDCFSRFNNLHRTWWRICELGRILASEHPNNSNYKRRVKPEHNGDVFADDTREVSDKPDKSSSYHTPVENGYIHQESLCRQAKDASEAVEFDVSVMEGMPEVDALLLQEASWDAVYARRLMATLHKTFPYVVYDIGAFSLKGNLFTGNSGLMLASRHRLQTVRFGLFTASCKQCRLASKGLIMAKVELGFLADGRKAVGYLYNTHLQAFQGTMLVQYDQMTEIVCWTQEFREATKRDDEVVVFDVLGGDFNLDNMSPVDATCQQHPLFTRYRDVGRREPGRDYSWAPGTELRQVLIYQPQISTPGGLKMALQEPRLLRTYVLDADIMENTIALRSVMPPRDEDGNVIVSPVGGKRRIDLVMCNTDSPCVKLESYNAVTALATLTDHIPVYLRLSIDLEHQPDSC